MAFNKGERFESFDEFEMKLNCFSSFEQRSIIKKIIEIETPISKSEKTGPHQTATISSTDHDQTVNQRCTSGQNPVHDKLQTSENFHIDLRTRTAPFPQQHKPRTPSKPHRRLCQQPQTHENSPTPMLLANNKTTLFETEQDPNDESKTNASKRDPVNLCDPLRKEQVLQQLSAKQEKSSPNTRPAPGKPFVQRGQGKQIVQTPSEGKSSNLDPNVAKAMHDSCNDSSGDRNAKGSLAQFRNQNLNTESHNQNSKPTTEQSKSAVNSKPLDDSHGSNNYFHQCDPHSLPKYPLSGSGNSSGNVQESIGQVKTVQVNDALAQAHQQCFLNFHWPRLNKIRGIRPFLLKDPKSTKKLNVQVSRPLAENEASTQRQQLATPLKRTNLLSDNNSIFASIKMDLDQLLISSSSQDGLMVGADINSQRSGGLQKLSDLGKSTMPEESLASHAKGLVDQIPTDLGITYDEEVLSFSQPISMEQMNAVVTLLNRLPVEQQISYFNDRIQTSLFEASDSKPMGKDTLHQLLVAFVVCLLRHQQVGYDCLKSARHYLYRVGVVNTLVGLVSQKQDALQVISVICWLLTFLIIGPVRTQENQEKLTNDESQHCTRGSLDKEDKLLEQFLASEGARVIARRLQEDSLPGPTYMGVSVNIALPVVALASTPLGRNWLEQNCREHISEYKSLLIHKKSVLDVLPVVFPLLTREGIDRIVDEFVSFAESVEAKDRERNLAELLEEEEQERIKREQRKKKKRQKKQGRTKKGGFVNPGTEVSSEDEQLPIISKIRALPSAETDNRPPAFDVVQDLIETPSIIPQTKNRDIGSVAELPLMLKKGDSGSLKKDSSGRVFPLQSENQDPFPEDFPPITRRSLKKSHDTNEKSWVKTDGQRHIGRDCLKRDANARGQMISRDASKPLRWADVARIGCSSMDRKSHLTVLSSDPDTYPKVSILEKANNGSAAIESDTRLRMNTDNNVVGDFENGPCYCVTASCENQGNDVDLTQSSDNESDDETQSSSSECPHLLFSPSLYPRALGSAFNVSKSLSTPKQSPTSTVPGRKNKNDSSFLAWPFLNCLKRREGSGSESMPCLWEDPKINNREYHDVSQPSSLSQKRCPSTETNKDNADSIRLPQVGNVLHRTRSMDVMDSENCSKRKYHRPLTQPDTESISIEPSHLKRSLISDFTNANKPVMESDPSVPCFSLASKTEPFTNLPLLKDRPGSPEEIHLSKESWKIERFCSVVDATGGKQSRDVMNKAMLRAKPYLRTHTNTYKHPGYRSFTFFPSACNIPQVSCDQKPLPMVIPLLNSSSVDTQSWTADQLCGQHIHTNVPTTLEWQAAESDMLLQQSTKNVDAEVKSTIHDLNTDMNDMVTSVENKPSTHMKSTILSEASGSFKTLDATAKTWHSTSKVFTACAPRCESTTTGESVQQRHKEVWQLDFGTSLTNPFTSIPTSSTTNTSSMPAMNNARAQACNADQELSMFGQKTNASPLLAHDRYCVQQSPRSTKNATSSMTQTITLDLQAKFKLPTNSRPDFPLLCKHVESVELHKGSQLRAPDEERLVLVDQHEKQQPHQKATSRVSGTWQPFNNQNRQHQSRQPLLQQPSGGTSILQQRQEHYERPISPLVLFPDELRDKFHYQSVDNGVFPAFHEARTGDFLNELFTDPQFVDKIAVNQLRQQIRASWTNVPIADTTLGVLRDSTFLDDLDYYASIYGVKVKDILRPQSNDNIRHSVARNSWNSCNKDAGFISGHVPNIGFTNTNDIGRKANESRRWREVLDAMLDLPWTRRHQMGDVILPPSGSEYKICQCSQGPMTLGYTTSGRESAVLVLDKRHFHLDPYRIEVLSDPELEHHFLLRCQGSGEDYQYQYVAFDLFEYTLAEYLQLLPVSSNREGSTVNSLTWQLLDGLNFIHMFLGTPHGNLRPSWIFVDMEGRLRLGGFGFEFIKSSEDIAYQGQNRLTDASGYESARWLLSADDELAGLSPRPSFVSDIQMAGMLIYHILTRGQHTFTGSALDMEVGLIRESPIADCHLGEEAFDLLSGMIFPEPELRPSAEQCLKHPFFWSAERKFRLILIVGSDVLTEMKTGVALTGCGAPTMMEILGLVDINEVSPNWVQEVNMTVMKEMRSFRVYKNNLSELALFIYNCCLHFDKLSNVAKDVLDEPCKYFQTLFPSLFMAIYRSLKSSDRVQRTCYKPFF